MANTTSAKKATRKIARRTIINKSRRTQMRGAVRTVEEAIKSGDREAALKAMKNAEPELMQAAQRNIIHKNNASRKVSRLTHAIELTAIGLRKSPASPGFFFSDIPGRASAKIHFPTHLHPVAFRAHADGVHCDNSIVPLLRTVLRVTFPAPVISRGAIYCTGVVVSICEMHQRSG
jgi:small subunit ribosomal protein S20